MKEVCPMNKRVLSFFLTFFLTLVMVASLCVSALAFDPMDPPEPGAAEGFVETKAVWSSMNMLAGHRTTETSYTYDDAGRILTRTEVVTDQDVPENNSRNTYLYEYDSDGRVSRIVREDGNHEFVYAYQQDGSHYQIYTWWDDSSESHETRTRTLTYDPSAKWYWYGEWTFSFDDKGNLTGRTSKTGEEIVYENTFDDAGRLSVVTMTSQKDGVQETQTYTYNEDGSYILTWGSKTGAEIFTYNAKGQLVKYDNTYWDDPVGWKYEYDEHGNCVLRSYGDATSMTYTYEAMPTPTPKNPFVDVARKAYYYDAVLWAVNHDPQITNGTDETHFSPNATCTRGQVVTFLWRAAGSPKPSSSKNPFTDISKKAYYYDAVLWAVEKGITNGTSDTTFGPNEPCTRGQVVTFLHRYEGKPKPTSAVNPFTDVKKGAFYYDAVLWAVKKGITNGTTETTFSPDSACTRGQIVTFLYRDMG